MDKKLSLLAITVGGIIGGFVPELWGAGAFSAWAIITSTIGSLVALWLAWHYIG